MTAVFIKILNMSIAASWLVLAVVLLRFFFKKGPKWIVCLLWGLVGLRLVMPFTFESSVSLIPSAEIIPVDVAVSETPAIYSGIPAVNSAVNPLVTQYASASENIIETVLHYATIVWLIGTAGILLYSVAAYLKLRWQVRVSVRCRDNIYICDNVESPFLLGIFRPRIYVPSGMEEDHLDHVIAHENAHIKRRDHWWKPLSFLLLAVYWFNPLLWAAYILLCRDIERACDEKVIAGMDPAGKIGYSEALTVCSIHRRMIMVCPVAFGELSVKARIKDVLHYKKPALWVICASVVLCVITAGCFLTNPVPCVHAYKEQITTEPTCTETGIQTRLCSHCQHSYTVTVDMVAHTYDDGVVIDPATCTHQGMKLRQCVCCGDEITEAIEETGHISNGTIYIKEPNCTEEGEEYTICSQCSELFVTRVLQTNDNHDLQETVLKEATCTHPGEGTRTCSRCGYSESCSYAQLEHSFVKTNSKEATCTHPGEETRTCSRCGYSESYSYAQLEHSYVKTNSMEATCSTYGWYTMTCTGCGDAYIVKTGAGDHKWVWLNSEYKICEYCGWRVPNKEYSLFDNNTEDSNDLISIIRSWP